MPITENDNLKIYEVYLTFKNKETMDRFHRSCIEVILVNPYNITVGYEYMTSYLLKCKSLHECLKIVAEDVALLNLYDTCIRAKVESPPYEEYFETALYAECHYKVNDPGPSDVWGYRYFDEPTSFSIKPGRENKYLATERTWQRNGFRDFVKYHSQNYANREIELCLIDTNSEQDREWFDSYLSFS